MSEHSRNQERARPNVNKVLCKYLKKEKWILFWGIVFLLLSNFGVLLVPLYVGWCTNELAEGQPENYA